MSYRVAIIAPPYPLEEAPAPPLGVCYVAAAFEAAGCEVRIFDFVVSEYRKEKLARWMDDFRPNFVGSTSVTMNFPGAADIMMDVKDIDPSVTTVMGGPHVSFWAPQTLKRYPGIDFIVAGEGEVTISEMVPRLAAGDSLDDVAGLYLRRGDEIVFTGTRKHLEDLDQLPRPARHLLPISRYQALGFPVSVITSRGCPNACIFCLGRRMVGPKVRYRSPHLVVEEIAHLLDLGFWRINVADDLFTANKKRVATFCSEIERRGLKFGWTAFSRVNTIDEETLVMMKAAGCDCISFGMESGRQEMLNLVKKGITLDQAREASRLCKKVGIIGHASYIVGLPGETPEGLEETDRVARELGFVYGYHHLSPFPGSTIMDKLEEFDLEILTDDWSQYDANRPIVKTSRLTPEMSKAFVDRHHAHCAEEMARIEKGFVDRTNTPEEDLLILGNRKLETVFAIIDTDLIERFGTLEENDGDKPDTSLAAVGSRIAAHLGKEQEPVARVLWDFFKNGYIVLGERNGKKAWVWAPNPAKAWPGVSGKKAV